MINVDTTVTYLDREDIIKFKRDMPIEQVTMFDVIDRDILYKSHVLILKLHGEYKVLKSKF